MAAHDRGRTGAELEERWPRDRRRHALRPHRRVSGLDRRRLLARPAHDTRTRRGIGGAATTVTRDHSRFIIRVGSDAASDKGEIKLLFGWQDALRQRK